MVQLKDTPTRQRCIAIYIFLPGEISLHEESYLTSAQGFVYIRDGLAKLAKISDVNTLGVRNLCFLTNFECI